MHLGVPLFTHMYKETLFPSCVAHLNKNNCITHPRALALPPSFWHAMAVFSRFARWPNYRRKEATASGNDVQSEFVSDGDYKYTVGLGGNNSGPSYQEVSGAPVESNSPLGYSVGSITILFLNISMMIGTGIYSTRQYSSLHYTTAL